MADAKTIEKYRRNAIMSALGYAVKLADPNDDGCKIYPFDDEKDRETREAVSNYLHSWIIGPLAAALGADTLAGFERQGPEGRKAEEYLADLKALLGR